MLALKCEKLFILGHRDLLRSVLEGKRDVKTGVGIFVGWSSTVVFFLFLVRKIGEIKTFLIHPNCESVLFVGHGYVDLRFVRMS